MTYRVLLLLLPTIFFASATFAGNEHVRFALHRKDTWLPAKRLLCDNLSIPGVQPNTSPNYDHIACINYTVTGPAPGASMVYLVAVQGSPTVGILGVSVGIDYEGRRGAASGIDPQFVTWILCADGSDFQTAGELGFWPAPKGGNRIVWAVESCQRETIGVFGVHAVAGVFYVYAYSEDVLGITPNNTIVAGPELAVVNCEGGETNLLDLYPPQWLPFFCGRVHLGGDGSRGYTPCGLPIMTESTTWGKIKTRFVP